MVGDVLSCCNGPLFRGHSFIFGGVSLYIETVLAQEELLPLFSGFYNTCEVVVWDFFHQESMYSISGYFFALIESWSNNKSWSWFALWKRNRPADPNHRVFLLKTLRRNKTWDSVGAQRISKSDSSVWFEGWWTCTGRDATVNNPTLDGFTFRLLRASKNPEVSHLTVATHEDYPEGMDVNSPFWSQK